MAVIFNPGSQTYTPQTINQSLTIGAGVNAISLTATRTDPSWVNATGLIATLSFFDPSGNLLASGDFWGGPATRHGVPLTTSSLSTTLPGGAGTYSAQIIIAQTVITTVQVVTS